MNLVITKKCNLSCSHCLWSCSPNHKEGHMDRLTFMNALKFMKDDHIHLIGGEAFTHPDILDFLDEIKYACNSFSTVTNGLWASPLMKEENMRRLRRNVHSDFPYRKYDELPLNAKKMFKLYMLYQYIDEFYITVSTDYYHKEEAWRTRNIDMNNIVDVFKDVFEDSSLEIEERDVTRSSNGLIPMGRALKHGCINRNMKCMTGYEYDGYKSIDSNQLTVLPNGDIALCYNGKMICCNVNKDTQENVLERIKDTKINRTTMSKCISCSKYHPDYKRRM